MAIDAAAIPVLDPVDEGWADPLTTIREHRVGGDHLIERRFFGAERVGQKRTHPVVNAKPFGIACHHRHPDFFGQTDRHQVPRLFDPGSQRRRPIIAVRCVLGSPEPLGRINLDRGVDQDGGGCIAAVESGGIDEGLERRTRLPFGLRRTVEDRVLIAEAALHRDHTTGVDVHRDKAALHFRYLPQAPADEPAIIARHPAHMNDVARFEIVEEVTLEPPDVFAWHDRGRIAVGPPFDPERQRLIGNLEDHGRPPQAFQVNVARHLGCRQFDLPVFELVRVDLLAGSAPLALLPVIALKLTAQGLGRDRLHLGIDGGPDGVAAGKELPLAKVLAQLAADFVGEVVARRQFRPIAFKVAILDRTQRHRALVFVHGLCDIAVFLHFLQDKVTAGQQAVLLPDRMIVRRRFRQRGKEGRLMRGKFAQALVEIGLAGSGDAIGILTQKDLVEIKLEDLFLIQCILKPRGQNDLFDLALGLTVTAQ